jgi:hypothetical protein
MRIFASTPRLTGPGCGALTCPVLLLLADEEMLPGADDGNVLLPPAATLSTHKNLLIHVRRFLSWSRNVSRGEVRLSI